MQAKISPAEVLREAIALLRYRIGLFATIGCLSLIFSLPAMIIAGQGQDPMLSGAFWLSSLGMMLLGLAMSVIMSHQCLTILRGDVPSLFPEAGIKKFCLLLVKNFLLFSAILIPGSVILLPFSFAAIMCAGVMGEGVGTNIALVLSNTIGCTLGFGFLAVRWGLTIPGIAVGDLSSFKKSWKMTKGHTFRLIIFFVPALLLNFLAQTNYVPDPETGTIDFFTMGNLVYTLASMAVNWVIFASVMVWYHRLNVRYEAIEAAGGFQEEVSDAWKPTGLK